MQVAEPRTLLRGKSRRQLELSDGASDEGGEHSLRPVPRRATQHNGEIVSSLIYPPLTKQAFAIHV